MKHSTFRIRGMTYSIGFLLLAACLLLLRRPGTRSASPVYLIRVVEPQADAVLTEQGDLSPTDGAPLLQVRSKLERILREMPVGYQLHFGFSWTVDPNSLVYDYTLWLNRETEQSYRILISTTPISVYQGSLPDILEQVHSVLKTLEKTEPQTEERQPNAP